MPLFRKGPANNTRPVRASRRISAVALVLLLLDQLLMGAATPAAPPPTHDIGWPRQVTQDGSELIYYQPQVDEWTDYKTLFARVAFSLTPAGEKQVLGVASMEAGTIV